MGRDRAYEREFLEQAERQAGFGGLGFPTLVGVRLEQVGARHGDRWESMDLPRVLREIREEGADLGGWSVLAGQLALRRLDSEHSVACQVLLQQIAGHGAAVEHLCRELLLLASE